MNEWWILSGSSITEVLLIFFLIFPEGKHNNLQHCSPLHIPGNLSKGEVVQWNLFYVFFVKALCFG